MPRNFAVGLGLIVSACSATGDGKEPDSPSVPFVSGQGVGFEGEGTSVLLKFGASRAEVEQLFVDDGQQQPSITSNEECGAGSMQFLTFDNGLMLNFQSDKFVGWFLDGETPVKTDKGLGTGDLLREFSQVHKAEPVAESTLGDEYYSTVDSIGAFAGEVSEDALVEAIYAGTNCFFR